MHPRTSGTPASRRREEVRRWTRLLTRPPLLGEEGSVLDSSVVACRRMSGRRTRRTDGGTRYAVEEDDVACGCSCCWRCLWCASVGRGEHHRAAFAYRRRHAFTDIHIQLYTGMGKQSSAVVLHFHHRVFIQTNIPIQLYAGNLKLGFKNLQIMNIPHLYVVDKNCTRQNDPPDFHCQLFMSMLALLLYMRFALMHSFKSARDCRILLRHTMVDCSSKRWTGDLPSISIQGNGSDRLPAVPDILNSIPVIYIWTGLLSKYPGYMNYVRDYSRKSPRGTYSSKENLELKCGICMGRLQKSREDIGPRQGSRGFQVALGRPASPRGDPLRGSGTILHRLLGCIFVVPRVSLIQGLMLDPQSYINRPQTPP